MKPFDKSDCKWSESCFVDASWRVTPPTDSLLSYEDIYTVDNQLYVEKKESEDKHRISSDSQSHFADDFPIYNEVFLNEDADTTEEMIKIVMAGFSQDQPEEKKNLQKEVPSALPAPISVSSRSSMQIMEDHLLERVFIRRLYGAIYLYNGRHYIPLTEQDYSILLRRESDDNIISILKSHRQFSDAYRFLSSNPDIEFKDYNKNSVEYKTVIAFENTLLDASTEDAYEHHPDYPVFFGVNACYKKRPGDTPNWDYFIESVSQGDKKIKKLIHEMLGYLLLQGNDGKCFFVLAPASNSGKSLLGDFIESLFPDAYVSHIAINDFSNRFALGSLWKTVVNVSMDLPQSTLSTGTVSLIKTITGDSKLTTEEKYMPIGTALNRCKLVFGTNSQISISAPDAAFWDRAIIVPFLYEVPRQERQRDLLAHLIEEKDDILSKCVPYVKKLIHRNYEFTMPEASVSMKNAWSGNAGDAIGKFFSQCCKFSSNSEGISVRKLYGYFLGYCDRYGLPPGVEDDRNFSRQVKKRYPEIEQKKCRTQDAKNPVSVFANVRYYPYES